MGARVLQEDNARVECGVVEHEWSGDAVEWRGVERAGVHGVKCSAVVWLAPAMCELCWQ